MPTLKKKTKTPKSEIRKDYFLNRFVVITPGRALRPRDIQEKTIISREKKCPFCRENIDPKSILDAIPAKNSWQVAAIKNLFPAVTFDNSKAYGTQEVIIETPQHNIDLARLSIEEIEEVLNMYVRRTTAIAKNKKIDYVLCFKNQGSKAGASITHAHSQVFATKIVPPDVALEYLAAKIYEMEHHSCAYCDILKKELKSSRRIFEDKNVGAFAPYASQFHYEAWVFPKRHLDNITQLNTAEIKSFAAALKKILLKLDSLNLSYNFFLHNIISDIDQHLYLKIQPRDSIWAGVELGSGLVINSVPPEEAAKFYRS